VNSYLIKKGGIKMICPNCKNQIAENTPFCPQCGTNVSQSQGQNNFSQPSQQNYNQNFSQMPLNNQNGKKFPIVPIVVLLVVAIIVVVAVFLIMKKDDKKETPMGPTNQGSNAISSNNKDTNEISNSNNNSNVSVDSNTNLTYDKDGALLVSIEDVFTITGRGTVVTGTVLRGNVRLNDEVQIIGLDKEIITTTVIGIEMFRKQLDYAEAGDNVGLVLKDVSREKVERGQVVAKPNSIKEAKKFEATINVLSKDEGGRHTPFYANYRPQFYFRTLDVTGVIELPESVEMVMPGDKNVNITVELISGIAMEVGTEFSIREGGRTVGKGIVTKVY